MAEDRERNRVYGLGWHRGYCQGLKKAVGIMLPEEAGRLITELNLAEADLRKEENEGV